ncbi:MAG TPA: AbrB/MazE/SpoVT family DNA-binding domain-containing protein [Microthrixaceae bacterium]|nr:AbrB/MazE/SpoVT family DNA-binding domain-containing protein [Microthrixaceae bacterium]HMT24641.1 AbrB/MazE/SpoVT family DNA-binding domain-containing protein [Microthrixaceae bacterium]HMT61533.1 AbrB/MazE/SpoVT family DNA-binding domain-containing protein [Microthrixaceae bacterium]
MSAPTDWWQMVLRWWLGAVKVAIDSAGRVVVPKALRDRLGLDAGTTVDISAHGSGLHLTPVGRSARVRTMRGETVAVPDTVITDDDVFAILDADRL